MLIVFFRIGFFFKLGIFFMMLFSYKNEFYIKYVKSGLRVVGEFLVVCYFFMLFMFIIVIIIIVIVIINCLLIIKYFSV